MRPVHVVVLLLAGALGGAVIMKVVQPGNPVVPVADVVPPQLPPPAPPVEPASAVESPPVQTPPAQPEPAPIVAVAPVEPSKPSPMPPAVTPAAREVSKPQRIRTVNSPVSGPESGPVSFAGLAAVLQATPQRQDPAPEPPPVAPPPAVPPVASAEPEHATPAPAQVSAAPVPQPHQVTLNAGFVLPVRLVDGISSERNVTGDVFAATLDRELVADGFVIAERGARVEGRVVAVDRAKARAAAALALELTALHTSDGQTVPIRTDDYFKHADTPQVDNATKIAGGAIIGAAIGSIAGGGKGAAIGAGIGVGAGAGDVLLTRRPAELSSETLVTFKLKNAIPLTEQLR